MPTYLLFVQVVVGDLLAILVQHCLLAWAKLGSLIQHVHDFVEVLGDGLLMIGLYEEKPELTIRGDVIEDRVFIVRVAEDVSRSKSEEFDLKPFADLSIIIQRAVVVERKVLLFVPGSSVELVQPLLEDPAPFRC